ncbi:TPA: restriction endonuclease [archaeon]|nr:restriction endonuclease [Candidatus Undinarchaeales archaeon SRR5007147.bin71]
MKKDLEKIEEELKEGADLEAILEKYDWRDFESLVASIFAERNYKVKTDHRFKHDGRHQIDVVAQGFREIFCVDCKKWSDRKGKISALKKAILDQKLRTQALKDSAHNKSDVYPLIVTLLQEDIETHENIPVVPVWKLNSFLEDFPQNRGQLHKAN